MMTETPELLPCPFCGSSKIEALKNFDWVGCQDCGAYLEDVEPGARKLWNTRVPPSTVAGSGAALAALLTWCQIERGKLVVDGYDYKSGEEFGIRRVELQIERAIRSTPTLANEKEGGEDEKPDYMLRGGPGRDYPCNLPNVLECAASECQAEQRCARTPRVASLIAKGEGK